MDFKQWQGFEKGEWTSEIDVRDFIQRNYTPYTGDESFLVGSTDKTNKLWDKVLKLFEKEKENGTPAENNPTGTEDYVEALKKLRDTTVPKTEYEKLKGENKRLLDTLVSGGSIDPEDAPGDKRTTEEIREQLFERETTCL